MGCCGGKRAALRADPHDAGATADTVMLRYTKRLGHRVLGSGTGRPYDFSAAYPVQPVHPADVQALIDSGRFERAG